ncbi:hypothetical protein P692DRAFT_20877129 [Suillus brevipes Sb2]|nr:hypothetical protein P692DRAFT_20877129 [Suillus brevipes Sb2]
MRPESDHETSSIDYLDLHAEHKHLIEIKMCAKFEFERQNGVLCIFPAVKTSLHTSDPFVDSDENHMLHTMHTVFSSFTSLVRHRRYQSQWNTVELPKSMIQRLAKLDDIEKKSLTRSLDESSYVFPDPLVSTTCNVQQLSAQMPTLSDVEDWTRDSMGSYTFSSARPSLMPTIPDVKDSTHDSIGSYAFSSARPSDVMSLSSTCSARPSDVMSLSSTRSSLHLLSDDGKELNLLDEPVYRTSPHLTGPTQHKQRSRTSAPRASQLLPQPTSSESVQRGSQYCPSPSLLTSPHLTGPTQRKQCSRTSAPCASQLLPQSTSSESVQRGSQPPPSREFIISPLSPPLKYRTSPSLPQSPST